MYLSVSLKSGGNTCNPVNPAFFGDIGRIDPEPIPLPLDRDSSHCPTVESPETRHLAGVV